MTTNNTVNNAFTKEENKMVKNNESKTDKIEQSVNNAQKVRQSDPKGENAKLVKTPVRESDSSLIRTARRLRDENPGMTVEKSTEKAKKIPQNMRESRMDVVSHNVGDRVKWWNPNEPMTGSVTGLAKDRNDPRLVSYKVKWDNGKHEGQFAPNMLIAESVKTPIQKLVESYMLAECYELHITYRDGSKGVVDVEGTMDEILYQAAKIKSDEDAHVDIVKVDIKESVRNVNTSTVGREPANIAKAPDNVRDPRELNNVKNAPVKGAAEGTYIKESTYKTDKNNDLDFPAMTAEELEDVIESLQDQMHGPSHASRIAAQEDYERALEEYTKRQNNHLTSEEY